MEQEIEQNFAEKLGDKADEIVNDLKDLADKAGDKADEIVSDLKDTMQDADMHSDLRSADNPYDNAQAEMLDKIDEAFAKEPEQKEYENHDDVMQAQRDQENSIDKNLSENAEREANVGDSKSDKDFGDLDNVEKMADTQKDVEVESKSEDKEIER